MKRLLALCLCATLVVGSSALATDTQTLTATSVQSAGLTVEPQNSATALAFEDIRSTMNEYNYTIAYMKATMSSMSDVDSDALYGILSKLYDLQTQLSDSSANMKLLLDPVKDALEVYDYENAAIKDPDGTILTQLRTKAALYGAVSANLASSAISLDSQISDLESAALSTDTSIETAKNTLNGTINQLIKGAESLYIGIVTLETGLESFDVGIASLERVVALTQVQYDRGLASLFELETMEYQLRNLKSQKETLEYQLTTMKVSLESMVGMERSGTIKLSPLTMPTAEELAAVDYATNVDKAMKQNVDYMNAEAEYFANMSGTTTKKNWVMATDNFKGSFFLTCLAVPEMARLVDVAEDTLAYQNRALEIATKSYELGMSSEIEYLSAVDAVTTAENDLYVAELNLFTEYRDYYWALNYGIV